MKQVFRLWLLAAWLVFMIYATGLQQGRFDVNDFAHAYNSWAQLRDHSKPGVINAQELQAWQAAKAEWRKLQRAIDNEY